MGQERRVGLGVDLTLGLLLGIAGFAAVRALAHTLSPAVVEFIGWFESDPDRVFLNMVDRWSDHDRSAVHPLFSAVTWPLVQAGRTLLHLGPLAAARFVLALAGAVYLPAFYALLRLAGCRRPDSVLFTILAGVSAASFFWFPVPETYSFAAVTVVLALIPAALLRHGPPRTLPFVLSGILAFGITVSNWMTALLASLAAFPKRRALALATWVFSAVVLLCLAQKQVFPSARFPLDVSRESRFLLVPESGGPPAVARSFFLHSMIMPAFERVPAVAPPEHCPVTRAYFRTQRAGIGTGSPWGRPAALLWGLLLLLGLHAVLRGRADSRLRLVIGLSLAAQLLLHLVYGAETFLYACDFLPLLVTAAALATLGRARIPALILAAGVATLALPHNLSLFRQARCGLAEMAEARQVPCLAGADLRHGAPSDLRGADLFAADLRGADLSGRDLRGAFLRETRLQGANLERADLRGARFLRANLGRARLGGAVLTGARIDQVYAGGADLRGSRLDSCWISSSDFGRADLSGAVLRSTAASRVSMIESHLEKGLLSDAVLLAADLRNAGLDSARLGTVDLREADLRGTRFAGSSFAGLRLRGSRFDEKTVWPADFVPGAAGAIFVPTSRGLPPRR